MPIKLTDIGANVAVRAGTPLAIVAGDAADGVEQSNSVWVNRNPLTDTGLPSLSPRVTGPYESAVLAFVLDATLAVGVTLSFAANGRTAADNSGMGAADYGTALAGAVVATGPTGGGRVIVVARLNLDFNLSTAGPYIGYQYTATLSTGAVDKVTVTPFWILGGSDVVPVV